MAAFAEALEANFSQGIAADGRTESDLIAEQSEIMSKDGRRATESNAEVFCEMFAVELESLGETVKDQIEIQFANYTDIEIGHEPTSRDRINREAPRG
jgi:hypothetical protein